LDFFSLAGDASNSYTSNSPACAFFRLSARAKACCFPPCRPQAPISKPHQRKRMPARPLAPEDQREKAEAHTDAGAMAAVVFGAGPSSPSAERLAEMQHFASAGSDKGCTRKAAGWKAWSHRESWPWCWQAFALKHGCSRHLRHRHRRRRRCRRPRFQRRLPLRRRPQAPTMMSGQALPLGTHPPPFTVAYRGLDDAWGGRGAWPRCSRRN
jgi:hypothetical protein